MSGWSSGGAVNLGELSGKTIKVPVLLEEKNIDAGTTTVTFSNLDGDKDEAYLLESKLSIVGGSADRIIELKPNNGDATACHMYYHNDTDNSLGGHGYSKWQLMSNMYSQDSFVNSVTEILAKSGNYRSYTSHGVSKSTTHTSFQVWAGYWSNTADNITSLVISIASGGSFSGIMKLYKMVDIQIP